jgi:hypothetical protein
MPIVHGTIDEISPTHEKPERQTLGPFPSGNFLAATLRNSTFA